jgi:regulator of replication initiation timing
LETDRVNRAENRQENFTRLQDEIISLEKENEELISKGETLNVEYENLLSNKETNYEEAIEREEKILEELKEKNNFLNSEVNIFKVKFLICEILY